MKIVTSKPVSEEYVVVTEAEIREFIRVGQLLAKVADARLGKPDTKVSVEADGWIRVLREDAFKYSVVLSSGVDNFVQSINGLEQNAWSASDDDFFKDDDDDDDEVEEEEDGRDSSNFNAATDFSRGVKVRAARDITVRDVYSATYEYDDDFVIVPQGTVGVVIGEQTTSTSSVRVAFKSFNLPSRKALSWVTSNTLQYKQELLNIPSYECACEFCTAENLKEIENYPAEG